MTPEQVEFTKENLPSVIIEGLRQCASYEAYIAFVEAQGIPSRKKYPSMIGMYDFNNVHALAFSEHGSFGLSCFLMNHDLDPENVTRAQMQEIIPDLLEDDPKKEWAQKLLNLMKYFDDKKAESPLADVPLPDCLERGAKREQEVVDFLFDGAKKLILKEGYTYEDLAG